MPIKTTSFLLDLFSVNREENLITASLLFSPQMYNALYYNDMCWGGVGSVFQFTIHSTSYKLQVFVTNIPDNKNPLNIILMNATAITVQKNHERRCWKK